MAKDKLKPIEDGLPPGTQIAYVPLHAEGDIDHKDVQFGFIVIEKPDMEAYVCRYFNLHSDELRTKANGEITPKLMMRVHYHHPKALVAKLIHDILEGRMG